MKTQFVAKTFNAEHEIMLGHIKDILTRYAGQGYDLSLRQLYYQFVANNLFPADRTWLETDGKWKRDPNGTPNAEPNYKWLGDIVSDGRLAGRIDWDMIKDRGREMVENPHWESPAEIVETAAKGFRIDKWFRQPNYVEVMVEKQALEGVLLPVCAKLDIPFTANKGYSSLSALYEAGQRLRDKLDQDKEVHIIYLGDHDPSGIDMSRDVLDRLHMFSHVDELGGSIHLHRVALNMDQIRVLRPPENPAKLTDSRSNSYVAKFGMSSWELDAIEPRRLAKLVTDAVEALVDDDIRAEDVKREDGMRADLLKFSKTYKPRK